MQAAMTEQSCSRPALPFHIFHFLILGAFLLTPFAKAQERPQKPLTVPVPGEIAEELTKELNDKEAALKKDIKEKFGGTGEVHLLTPENFRAEEINLSRKNRPDLYIYLVDNYYCSPTGNCLVWIYGKTGDHYQRYLEADRAQGIEPQKAFTKGYRDTIVRMHGSATQSYLRLFKFDGNQYQQIACFDRDYPIVGEDENGYPKYAKKPTVTPVKCY